VVFGPSLDRVIGTVRNAVNHHSVGEVFRIRHPEVDVARHPTPGGVDRRRLRSTAAALTSLLALAATTLAAGPAVAAGAAAGPCALPRTGAHHSLGVDSWNPSYARPDKPLDAVMIFLSFPDAKPLTTPAALASDYFPATTRFFQRASYGRFTLRPHPLKQWIVMPHSATSYEIQRDWDSDRRSAYLRDAVAAADPSVDFGRYDLVYLVADPDAPGVDSDATKVVNFSSPMHADGHALKRVVTVFEQHPPDRNVLAHETGHVFDLPDLYHRPTDGGGDWDTHVGDWDVMGSQFGLAPDFFGWHKWKLGWLAPRQVACVRPGGVGRLTLEPLEDPSAGGTRLAVVRTGEDTAIAVEARSAAGNDRSTCTEGVLVYRVRSDTESGSGPVDVIDTHPRTAVCWDQSVYPPLADAPLRVGETFTVPDDGTKVQVTDRTRSGSWTVRITPGSL
jgi:M6 family metalloprotease-like protein